MSNTAGYKHPHYAESLSEFGFPRELPYCGGWIIERQIPGYSDRDAMGCYPLFSCQRWSLLSEDFRLLQPECVSLALVADPFGNYELGELKSCFDVVLPFKQHYVIDLNSSIEKQVSHHHQRYAAKALNEVRVEPVENPFAALDEWSMLYSHLVKKHRITGIQAFSKASFARQLDVPGMTAFRASAGRSTVGMLLWYVDGEVGYYHLGASSDEGYARRASFGLFWTSIQHFKACGLAWLDLGAGAGLQDLAEDGLGQFKKGWSTLSKPAYFCGRIFNPEKYLEITKAKSDLSTSYFPAYRKGEFN